MDVQQLHNHARETEQKAKSLGRKDALVVLVPLVQAERYASLLNSEARHRVVVVPVELVRKLREGEEVDPQRFKASPQLLAVAKLYAENERLNARVRELEGGASS